MTEAAEAYVGLEAGFSAVVSDEVQIDRGKLRAFREKLQETEHSVSVHLLAGYLDCLGVIEGRLSGTGGGQAEPVIGKAMPV